MSFVQKFELLQLLLLLLLRLLLLQRCLKGRNSHSALFCGIALFKIKIFQPRSRLPSAYVARFGPAWTFWFHEKDFVLFCFFLVFWWCLVCSGLIISDGDADAGVLSDWTGRWAKTMNSTTNCSQRPSAAQTPKWRGGTHRGINTKCCLAADAWLESLFKIINFFFGC